MRYKTYAEAKIANPDSDIFTNDKEFKAVKDAPTSHFPNGWVVCNPADYCSSIKEFLEAGYIFSVGDFFIGIDGEVISVRCANSSSVPYDDDYKRYILSTATLNGGCKIPAKAEQWSVCNNTLPLCDLTDEQAGMLFNDWRKGVEIENCLYDEKHEEFVWVNCFSVLSNIEGIYRIKPKSERELFIDKSLQLMTSETDRTMEQMFGAQFDAGARYKDLTQHFGENI